MKSYSNLKSSGLDWLGDVPAHWEVKRLKYFAYIAGGSTPESGNPEFWDGDINWFTPEDVSQNEMLSDSKRKITKDGLANCAAKMFPSGAIVLTTRAPIGNVARTNQPFCTNQGCKAILCSELLETDFCFYLLKSFQKYLQVMGKGTTFFELSNYNLKNMPIPLPPLDEQRAIVAFIEGKSREIDEFVAAKERLIALCREEKAALIHNAVTGRLILDKARKPSGLDWLGDVPEHWEVKPLKYFASINPTKTNGCFGKATEQCVFLPMESISTDGKILRQEWRRVEEVQAGFTYFERGDVVIAKITPCFENGKGAQLEELESDFGFGTTELIVLRPSSFISARFLYYITASSIFRKRGREVMSGSAGQQRVPTQFVSKYFIALPPISEQRAIVAFIEREMGRIEAVVARTTREIELMRELRASLIAQAVSGQIDVRAAELVPQSTLSASE